MAIGTPNVARLARKGRTRRLIRLLESPDYDVARDAETALRALIRTQRLDERAVAELLKLLRRYRTEGVDVTVLDYREGDVAAARLLCQVGGDEAVDALSDVVASGARYGKGSSLPAEAARLLGQMRDRRAIPALIGAVREGTNWANAATAALAKFGDAASDELRMFLRDEDPLVRARAVAALATVGKSADYLLEGLRDDHIAVRLAAVEAMPKLPREHAIHGLISALEDPHYTIDYDDSLAEWIGGGVIRRFPVRDVAAALLAKMPEPRAVKALAAYRAAAAEQGHRDL